MKRKITVNCHDMCKKITSSNILEREKIYNSFINRLDVKWTHTNSTSFFIAEKFVVKDIFTKIIALKALSFYVNVFDKAKKEIEGDNKETSDTLKIILDFIKSNKDDKTLQMHGLSFLQQFLESLSNIQSVHFSNILEIIRIFYKPENKSSLIGEAACVLEASFSICNLENVKELIEQLLDDILENLFDELPNVREKSFKCLEMGVSVIGFEVVNKKVNSLAEKLKSQSCQKMLTYAIKNCAVIYKIWKFLVNHFGITLHTDIILLNRLLRVVEHAFLSQKNEEREQAMQCWYVLIENFALNPTIINHKRRLKLLLSPLKNPQRTVSLRNGVLKCLWLIICNLVSNSDEQIQAVEMLLKLCFDINTINCKPAPAISPIHLCRNYPEHHEMVGEMLSIILNCGFKESFNASVSLPPSPILNDYLFDRSVQLLFASVADFCVVANLNNKKLFDLAIFLLQCAAAWLSRFITTKRIEDYSNTTFHCLKAYFNLISCLEKFSSKLITSSQDIVKINHATILFYKALQFILIGPFAQPACILASTTYHSCIPVSENRFLPTIHKYSVALLLSSNIFPTAITESSFIQIWKTIFDKKMMNEYLFYDSALKKLKRAADEFSGDCANIYINMWLCASSSILKLMDEPIPDINCPEFDRELECIFYTILFPLTQSYKQVQTMNPSYYQKIHCQWSQLFSSLQGIISITDNDANMETHRISEQLLLSVKERIEDGDDHGLLMPLLADVVLIMIEKFRYDSIGKISKKPSSPFKYVSRKPLPLFNLTTCVQLLNFLFEKILTMVTTYRNETMTIVSRCFMKLLESMKKKALYWTMTSMICDNLKALISINPSAKFNEDTTCTVLQMWSRFCDFLETNVAPKLNEEQLASLSPLFVTALNSSNLHIKSRMRLMWKQHFANTSSTIPIGLHLLLDIEGLPPINMVDTSDADSQNIITKENIPVHISGSFLNREKNFTSFSPGLKPNLLERTSLDAKKSGKDIKNDPQTISDEIRNLASAKPIDYYSEELCSDDTVSLSEKLRNIRKSKEPVLTADKSVFSALDYSEKPALSTEKQKLASKKAVSNRVTEKSVTFSKKDENNLETFSNNLEKSKDNTSLEKSKHKNDPEKFKDKKDFEKSPFSSFGKKSPQTVSPGCENIFQKMGSKTPTAKSPSYSIYDLKEEEFVKVSSPKTTKRFLTPHQVEKMKERRDDIPALYNDMSQSCSQLSSQFIVENSQLPSQSIVENSQLPSQVIVEDSQTINTQSTTLSDLSFSGKITKSKKGLDFTSTAESIEKHEVGDKLCNGLSSGMGLRSPKKATKCSIKSTTSIPDEIDDSKFSEGKIKLVKSENTLKSTTLNNDAEMEQSTITTVTCNSLEIAEEFSRTKRQLRKNRIQSKQISDVSAITNDDALKISNESLKNDDKIEGNIGKPSKTCDETLENDSEVLKIGNETVKDYKDREGVSKTFKTVDETVEKSDEVLKSEKEALKNVFESSEKALETSDESVETSDKPLKCIGDSKSNGHETFKSENQIMNSFVDVADEENRRLIDNVIDRSTKSDASANSKPLVFIDKIERALKNLEDTEVNESEIANLGVDCKKVKTNKRKRGKRWGAKRRHVNNYNTNINKIKGEESGEVSKTLNTSDETVKRSDEVSKCKKGELKNVDGIIKSDLEVFTSSTVTTEYEDMGTSKLLKCLSDSKSYGDITLKREHKIATHTNSLVDVANEEERGLIDNNVIDCGTKSYASANSKPLMFIDIIERKQKNLEEAEVTNLGVECDKDSNTNKNKRKKSVSESSNSPNSSVDENASIRKSKRARSVLAYSNTGLIMAAKQFSPQEHCTSSGISHTNKRKTPPSRKTVEDIKEELKGSSFKKLSTWLSKKYEKEKKRDDIAKTASTDIPKLADDSKKVCLTRNRSMDSLEIISSKPSAEKNKCSLKKCDTLQNTPQFTTLMVQDRNVTPNVVTPIKTLSNSLKKSLQKSKEVTRTYSNDAGYDSTHSSPLATPLSNSPKRFRSRSLSKDGDFAVAPTPDSPKSIKSSIASFEGEIKKAHSITKEEIVTRHILSPIKLSKNLTKNSQSEPDLQKSDESSKTCEQETKNLGYDSDSDEIPCSLNLLESYQSSGSIDSPTNLKNLKKVNKSKIRKSLDSNSFKREDSNISKRKRKAVLPAEKGDSSFSTKSRRKTNSQDFISNNNESKETAEATKSNIEEKNQSITRLTRYRSGSDTSKKKTKSINLVKVSHPKPNTVISADLGDFSIYEDIKNKEISTPNNLSTKKPYNRKNLHPTRKVGSSSRLTRSTSANVIYAKDVFKCKKSSKVSEKKPSVLKVSEKKMRKRSYVAYDKIDAETKTEETSSQSIADSQEIIKKSKKSSKVSEKRASVLKVNTLKKDSAKKLRERSSAVVAYDIIDNAETETEETSSQIIADSQENNSPEIIEKSKKSSKVSEKKPSVLKVSEKKMRTKSSVAYDKIDNAETKTEETSSQIIADSQENNNQKIMVKSQSILAKALYQDSLEKINCIGPNKPPRKLDTLEHRREKQYCSKQILSASEQKIITKNAIDESPERPILQQNVRKSPRKIVREESLSKDTSDSIKQLGTSKRMSPNSKTIEMTELDLIESDVLTGQTCSKFSPESKETIEMAELDINLFNKDLDVRCSPKKSPRSRSTAKIFEAAESQLAHKIKSKRTLYPEDDEQVALSSHKMETLLADDGMNSADNTSTNSVVAAIKAELEKDKEILRILTNEVEGKSRENGFDNFKFDEDKKAQDSCGDQCILDKAIRIEAHGLDDPTDLEEFGESQVMEEEEGELYRRVINIKRKRVQVKSSKSPQKTAHSTLLYDMDTPASGSAKNISKKEEKKMKVKLSEELSEEKLHTEKDSVQIFEEVKTHDNVNASPVRKLTPLNDLEFCSKDVDAKLPSEKTKNSSPVVLLGDGHCSKSNGVLAAAISTPERIKRKAKRHNLGTRAAMIVACAKKTMESRNVKTNISHASVSELLHPRLETMKLSPVGNSPINRKRSIGQVNDDKPWVKHEPSPSASPSSGILKKYENDFSPLPKSRRVSFADPPVSESVLIPTSPKSRSLGLHKAQKRLDMSPAFAESCVRKEKTKEANAELNETAFNENEDEETENNVKKSENIVKNINDTVEDCEKNGLEKDKAGVQAQVLKNNEQKKNINLFDSLNIESQENDSESFEINLTQPLYPDLISCLNPIEELIPSLISPSLHEGLRHAFKERNLKTVGDFCFISEMDLNYLPVKAPKKLRTLKFLKKYSEKLLGTQSSINEVDKKKEAQSSINEVDKKKEAQSLINKVDKKKEAQSSINEVDKKNEESSINEVDKKKVAQSSINEVDKKKEAQSSINEVDKKKEAPSSINEVDKKKDAQSSINEVDKKKEAQSSINEVDKKKEAQSSINEVDKKKETHSSINEVDKKKEAQSSINEVDKKKDIEAAEIETSNFTDETSNDKVQDSDSDQILNDDAVGEKESVTDTELVPLFPLKEISFPAKNTPNIVKNSTSFLKNSPINVTRDENIDEISQADNIKIVESQNVENHSNNIINLTDTNEALTENIEDGNKNLLDVENDDQATTNVEKSNKKSFNLENHEQILSATTKNFKRKSVDEENHEKVLLNNIEKPSEKSDPDNQDENIHTRGCAGTSTVTWDEINEAERILREDANKSKFDVTKISKGEGLDVLKKLMKNLPYNDVLAAYFEFLKDNTYSK